MAALDRTSRVFRLERLKQLPRWACDSGCDFICVPNNRFLEEKVKQT